MATLKYRHAHGFGWVCDVQSVQVGVAWEVPDDFRDRPGQKQREAAFGPFNIIDHGMAEPDPCEPDETPLPDTAVEVLVGRAHPHGQTGERFEVHIVTAGKCWLLGDDGRTIDRIP